MVGKRCAAAAAVKQKGPSPWDLLGLESSDTPSYGLRLVSNSIERSKCLSNSQLASDWHGPTARSAEKRSAALSAALPLYSNQGSAFSEAAAMTHR
jgi:hypothetical protein